MASKVDKLRALIDAQRALRDAIAGLRAPLLQAEGITAAQHAALKVLGAGPLSVAELAAALRIPRQVVQRRLAALTESGLVAVADAGDPPRRAATYTPTPEGQRRVEAVDAAEVERLRSASKSLKRGKLRDATDVLDDVTAALLATAPALGDDEPAADEPVEG